MERRFILALLLTGAVVVITPLIFKTPPPPPVTAAADSSPTTPIAGATTPSTAATTATGATAPGATKSAAATTSPPINASGGASRANNAAPQATAGELVVVKTPLSTVSFSTLGGAPQFIQADSYPALNGGRAGAQRVTLKHGNEPLLRYRVVSAGDTLALDQMVFTAAHGTATAKEEVLTFTGTNGSRTATITHHLALDNYLTTTTISVTGIASQAFLLIDLPSGFDTQERDSIGDLHSLAYSVKPVNASARGTAFTKLDEGESKLEPGPLSWAVAKSKYFVVGLLAPTNGTPFAEAHIAGGPRVKKNATTGFATAVLPLVNNSATFELYAGPQSWQRLRDMGRDFYTLNPYGGFVQPMVQPFSTIVMRLLLWMKKVLGLNYGWVLVIFGVAVRLLMWPLNQSAMRASLRLQRIQPELTAAQAKHKGDPQKAQAEVMRIYKEHNMSPFSALSGCLPALIPMPVLMALFFVFQNTIEFRDVPFLWLRDISIADPYYILPLLMGVSMYVLSWIGMRNMPPNPQAKMMSWMMPIMLTFFLIQSAAGLSLYYTVQQIAALPQQWLISNERAKTQKTT